MSGMHAASSDASMPPVYTVGDPPPPYHEGPPISQSFNTGGLIFTHPSEGDPTDVGVRSHQVTQADGAPAPGSNARPAIGSTAVLLLAAILGIVVVCIVVALAGSPRDGAGVAAMAMILGCGCALIFHRRWR